MSRVLQVWVFVCVGTWKRQEGIVPAVAGKQTPSRNEKRQFRGLLHSRCAQSHHGEKPVDGVFQVRFLLECVVQMREGTKQVP